MAIISGQKGKKPTVQTVGENSRFPIVIFFIITRWGNVLKTVASFFRQ
jgi:hypothetical protein